MSSSDNVTSSNCSTSSERVLGRVKWFNSKAGYGFISITDGQRAGTDIFVHHSAINVENQQYRYLVQGEYVEFSILDTPNGAHECQASSVCGIKSGKLMCETRREFKIARNNYKSHTHTQPTNNIEQNRQAEMPVQQRRDRPDRPDRPQRNNVRTDKTQTRDENGKWTLVSKNNGKTLVSEQPQTRQPESRPARGRPRKVSQ